MSYRRAEDVLPVEIIQMIQTYIDGEILYIPRKDRRREWGHRTTVRQELKERNRKIYYDYELGLTRTQLAGKYYLSVKSIQRIIKEEKSNQSYNSWR